MSVHFDVDWCAHGVLTEANVQVQAPINLKQSLVIVPGDFISKSLFFNLAMVVTFLNRFPPRMVISAPVSIISYTGTPCSWTGTHCGILPLS